MLTMNEDGNISAESKFLSHVIVTTIAGVGLLCGVLLVSPVSAQQRVVVEKATGNVVDIGDRTLQYDTRYFDHMDFPASPIPSGESVKKYMRDALGAIVLRPKDELIKDFADERRNDLIARINGSGVSAELKTLLIEIVKSLPR